MTDVLHLIRPLPEIPYDKLVKQVKDLSHALYLRIPSSLQTVSVWEDTLKNIVELLQMERKADIRNSRATRGIQALGSIFSWCCDVFTESQAVPFQTDIKNLAKTINFRRLRQH